MSLAMNVQAEKYGLIIAVGDYPRKTGWTSINSVNDIGLIKQALQNQDFKDENIIVVKNADATKEGILTAIANLRAKIQPGDIVVIHYSGHGQQIFDDDGDELDSKDESLVPYDALVRYTSYYKGENHIRDDELGMIIADFRNTLGKDGQLLITLDSCHSGSASRGGKARGGEATFAPPGWSPGSSSRTAGSGLIEDVELNDNPSPFVMFSGASADELNYEYEGYGSLSFSFLKAMNELGTDFTYRQLFSSISATMNVISPNQTPVMEGDVDYKLFNGEYVNQQPYFSINSISASDLISINGGKLQRLFEGTSVHVLPAGSIEVAENEIITSGKITSARYNEAEVLLDSPLADDNNKAYWVFIDKPSYGDIGLRVHFDESTDEESVLEEIKSFLAENNLGELVEQISDSDVVVSKSGSDYELSATNDLAKFNDIGTTRGGVEVEALKEKLFNYAQGNYLKGLSFKNYDYEFDFRLIPYQYDQTLKELVEHPSPDKFVDENGLFTVKAAQDTVKLEVTNYSDQDLYFSIIEINTQGEISPFYPNPKCSQKEDEKKIPAGESRVVRCKFHFKPPEETLVLKGFASDTELNFQPTVRSRGRSRGSITNPLERFLSKTYQRTRGSDSSGEDEDLKGFSAEFLYAIKKE